MSGSFGRYPEVGDIALGIDAEEEGPSGVEGCVF